MQFPSPPAARSSPAAQAASSPEAAAPAPGQPGPSCPAHGASRRRRPGTSPAGRVEEEEEEEEEEESLGQDPNPPRNTWLRYCHFFLRGKRREPARAMGGCEVREFLLQFGFFLPLLTAWTGDCSHVSNQVVLLDTTTVMGELGWKTYPLNGFSSDIVLHLFHNYNFKYESNGKNLP
ncbi:ephrin type-A receptor [Cricetulus griseus]|uniref:Ephrin type-A receptor n=1 Tax=Cricetulus griseus TaxID=10029 RepID=A0A061I767_CRIGR|nr:ephrin type-A receptor [Cricetulus griseus]